MLILKQEDNPNSKSTFSSDELLARFQEKYKGFNVLKATYMRNNYPELPVVHDLKTSKELKKLVRDTGGLTITLMYQDREPKGDEYVKVSSITMQQLVNQCSTICVQSANRYDTLYWEIVNDFTYLIGYTVVMVSISSNNMADFEKIGFKPISQFKNRRTNNTIHLMFKQLELCL